MAFRLPFPSAPSSPPRCHHCLKQDRSAGKHSCFSLPLRDAARRASLSHRPPSNLSAYRCLSLPPQTGPTRACRFVARSTAALLPPSHRRLALRQLPKRRASVVSAGARLPSVDKRHRRTLRGRANAKRGAAKQLVWFGIPKRTGSERYADASNAAAASPFSANADRKMGPDEKPSHQISVRTVVRTVAFPRPPTVEVYYVG